MAIIVILCGAPHLYKKDMNNSGLLFIYKNIKFVRYLSIMRSHNHKAMTVANLRHFYLKYD